MEFMGIGTWELMVIGLIALIVLGPKQMILMARKAGELLRQMQEIWAEASKTLDKEIKAIEEEAGDLTALPKEITALTNEMKNALTLDLSIKPETTAAAQPTIRPPNATSAWGGAPATPPNDTAAPPPNPTPAAPVTSDPATPADQSTSPAQTPTPQPTETPVKYSAWTSKRN